MTILTLVILSILGSLLVYAISCRLVVVYLLCGRILTPEQIGYLHIIIPVSFLVFIYIIDMFESKKQKRGFNNTER